MNYSLKISNNYGNVDIRERLPKQYCHVAGKRLVPLCKKLKIKHSPALIDFEDSGRWGYKPVIDGVVISNRSLPKLQDEIKAREERRKKRNPEKEKEYQLRAKERKQQKETQDFQEVILSIYPHMPEKDAACCASHATEIGSGRVGRSTLAEEPHKLAVIAYLRHNYTDYDKLLNQDWDRELARDEIYETVQKKLKEWEGGDTLAV